MKILFVNSCVRKVSNTETIAREFLRTIVENQDDVQIEEVNLKALDLKSLSEEDIVERDKLVKQKELTHPMFCLSKQFASADKIVIASPYYDLSFSAMLKVYFENVCCSGVTFEFAGALKGLCKAQKAIYVSTCGGFVGKNNLGCDYIKTLCQEMFGIPSFNELRAEGLDVVTLNQSEIMKQTIEVAKQLARTW